MQGFFELISLSIDYWWIYNVCESGTSAGWLKDGWMGCSDKVSLWYVALLINTRFRFFILE